jgi:HEAT repeat protein
MGVGVAFWAGHAKHEDQPADVIASLIEQLGEPANKVEVVGHIVPGGEMLAYSPPMQRLIALGDAARAPLHRRLGDKRIQNEVVLILGAIGDDSTVPLLIDAYPDAAVPAEPAAVTHPDPIRLSHICFAHALTCLTHQSISRSRWGTDFSPANRKKWQDWWAKNRKVFWVTGEPGTATFIPDSSPCPRTLKTVPEVLAQLDEALKDEDAQVRAAAADGYGRLGPQARGAVAHLIAALQDPDAAVRNAAAGACYFIQPDRLEVVLALLEAMRHDKVGNVRSSAALSLARVGEPALSHLLKALKDEDPETRRLAASALGEVAPKRKALLPALQAASRDKDANVRSYALGSMEIIDSSNPLVFQALLAGLADPSPVVRQGCAWHFGRMGPRAEPATRRLVGLLQDKEDGVRREVIYALLRIGSLSGEHVPLLIALLKDKTWEVRASAAEALGKVGPGAKDAVEGLRKTLKDRQRQVRWWAAEALGGIGPDARSAIPDLIEALRDEEELVRNLAGQALKKIDPVIAAKAGVP